MKRLTYFYNANIITMDGVAGRAPHMLIADGRVWACGNGVMPFGLDFRQSGFTHTRRQHADDIDFIDLKGATVMPGMTDAHIHFMNWAINQTRADLGAAGTEDEAVALLKAHASRHANEEWIIGYGWSHNTWPGGRLPSLESLDKAFPGNPVFLASKCGHLAWVNTAALRLSDLDASVADSPGGEIMRAEHDGHVRLTGILKENAVGLVEKNIGAPSPQTMRDAFLHGQHIAHTLVLTAMHTPEDMDTFAFLQRMKAEGELRLRINFMPPISAIDALESLRLSAGFGDEWLRICAVKMFTDGSLGGRTAYMYEPYEDDPANKGICVTDEEALVSCISRSNRIGLPTAVHAIGDRAVGSVLRALEKVHEAEGMSPLTKSAVKGNRIEHFQLFSPDDMAIIRRVRPVASVQPIHLCADMAPADRYWGGRSRYTYAFKTIADAGCNLAFGSDGPVEPINPFLGIYAAVTRMNLEGQPDGGWHPEERIGIMEALHGYTQGAAIAAGQAERTGSLTPGKFADFLVIDADPTTITPHDLLQVKPRETWINGECVFSQQDQKR